MYLIISLFMFVYAIVMHNHPNAPLIFISASIFAVADAVDSLRSQLFKTIRQVNISNLEGDNEN